MRERLRDEVLRLFGDLSQAGGAAHVAQALDEVRNGFARPLHEGQLERGQACLYGVGRIARDGKGSGQRADRLVVVTQTRADASGEAEQVDVDSGEGSVRFEDALCVREQLAPF